ncbi:MAG: cytochrome C oxidase subunit IV family protein [Rhodocyclaceae bacterium]|nr:cytochrome C oxidase subunit IV family protein [Rhodocyclaceae bacterium]
MSIHFLNVLWVALLVATLLTWLIGKTGHAGTAAVVAILVIAALKGWMIIYDFMALRRVTLLWRALVLGWLILVLAIILLAYWLGLK